MNWYKYAFIVGAYVLCVCDVVANTQMAGDENVSVQRIKVLQDSTNQDGSIDYFHTLLSQALDATAKEFGDYSFVRISLPYSQERSLHFLNERNRLDVMHTMTNSEREKTYRAVKVPLLKGLMGYRMLITNKRTLAKIQKITSGESLKSLVACQGQHWPDSDILEYNGFQVARVVVFEAMYEMLSKGRCDYFPRGIHEAFSEYTTFIEQYPNLKLVKNVLLHYDAPVYFFVGKTNQYLAQRIETGLKRLDNTGRLDALLKTNSTTARIFPLEQWQGVSVIPLENPKQDRLIDTSRFIKLGSRTVSH